MGNFQSSSEPSTVWLSGLIEAMNEVASLAAKPSAIDRKALANRLELPAMLAPPGALTAHGKPSSKGLVYRGRCPSRL
jgi:hypothetical protein